MLRNAKSLNGTDSKLMRESEGVKAEIRVRKRKDDGWQSGNPRVLTGISRRLKKERQC